MSTVIFILIILSGYHLYMENVVIPVNRQSLRLKFLELGERLKRLHLEHVDKISDNILIDLHMAIMRGPSLIEHYNLFSLIVFNMSIKKSQIEAIDAKANEFYEAIEKCEVKEIKYIMNQHFVLSKKAFMVNLGGWTLYALPIILVLFLLKQVKAVRIALIKEYRKQIIFLVTEGTFYADSTKKVNKKVNGNSKGALAY